MFASTSFWLLLFLGLCPIRNPASDNPLSVARDPSDRLSGLLTAHLDYPPAMQQAGQQGVVVITFCLTEAGCVADLNVHSQDKTLNEHITRQLAGKFVFHNTLPKREVYTVRLRFWLR